jgi:hypothetical protein
VHRARRGLEHAKLPEAVVIDELGLRVEVDDGRLVAQQLRPVDQLGFGSTDLG